MKARIGFAALIAVACLAGCTGSEEPTFEAEVGNGYLLVYGTSKKAYKCELRIAFTFLDEKGERKPGEYLCFEKEYPAGEKVQICEARHPGIVEPVLKEIQVTKCSSPAAG